MSDNNTIYFEISKNNPTPNPQTYRIVFVQDMLNAVTSDNIDKFIHEFEMVLRSAMLMRAINEGLIAEGKASADSKIEMPYYDWIDD